MARRDRLAELAETLDLDVERVGICWACLSFVALPLHRDDVVQAKREARWITPHLWAEGLAEPALAAVREACADGVEDAEAALADLELGGGRSATARAIVVRLARDAARIVDAELLVLETALPRLRAAPPELN